MKLAVARTITYGAIGAAALLALWLTPPITSDGRPAQVTALITGDSSESPIAVSGFAFHPIIVPATRTPGVDTIVLGGIINSSLYAALDRTGEGELPKAQRRTLAWKLADIFAFKIDMSRDIMKGDEFNVLVERLQEPDGTISVNKILGARFMLGNEEHEAIRFESKRNRGEWYDENGKSLTASFLRAPLEFRRISSVFGGRRHPISGKWKQHAGTDYAAPTGTPVRAIGDGVVVSVGRKGGYGNAIDVRHSNGYVSRYAHLSRFAKGLRRGARVTMGKTIGYVGSTGWATGPHLHFEIRVNGVARDPRVALRGKNTGAPLNGTELQQFKQVQQQTMLALRPADPANPLSPATQVASSRDSARGTARPGGA